MRKLRAVVVSCVATGVVGVGLGALSVQAAAAESTGTANTPAGACGVYSLKPTQSGPGLTGRTGRGGCTGSTSYLWSTIYEDINNLPDSEVATAFKRGVIKDHVDAHGTCQGHAPYYTFGRAAPGGAEWESGHPTLC